MRLIANNRGEIIFKVSRTMTGARRFTRWTAVSICSLEELNYSTKEVWQIMG